MKQYLNSLINYLEAATSSASPSSPQTPLSKSVYTQETGYVIKDIKIPISTIEDFQKALTPYEITQKISSSKLALYSRRFSKNKRIL